MPITVRIAHTARIASKTLTPRMRNMAKWGIAGVAGWWPVKRLATATRAAPSRRKSAARLRTIAERMRPMGRFMRGQCRRSRCIPHGLSLGCWTN
jgi:hypothetical protein